MEYGKIDKLIEACCSFVDHCDPSTTSLALREFPARRADNPTLPLTCDYALLRVSLLSMQASGSTPLADAMLDVLTGVPVTRGVIVSDGEADSAPEALDAARRYREADIPVDCVHIGASASGEDTLKQIAEITGGVYIKFTDIHKFSGAFKYLTPGLYGMLTAGAISADELGAKELK
jgi:hypothetical protein